MFHPYIHTPVGFPQNRCCFHHFRHESRDTSQLVIGSAYSCTNPIRNGHRGLAGRHERPYLGQKAGDSHRSDKRRFSGHVWSCQKGRVEEHANEFAVQICLQPPAVHPLSYQHAAVKTFATASLLRHVTAINSLLPVKCEKAYGAGCRSPCTVPLMYRENRPEIYVLACRKIGGERARDHLSS